MDKWIRKKNLKRANGVLTCGNEDIPFDFGPNNSIVGGKGEEKRRKRKRKREKKKEEREAPHFL